MSYRDKRAAQSEESTSTLACLACNVHTDWQTLSNFGARCRRCFSAYANGGRYPLQPDDEPMTKAEKTALLLHLKGMLANREPDKGWAYRLRDKERSGVDLTFHQRWAWRSALREAKESA